MAGEINGDNPNYLRIDDISITLQYEPTKHGGRIHLRTANVEHMIDGQPDRFTDEHGTKPGLHLIYDTNPGSADYNPAYFNRFGRKLREYGKVAPAEDVPLASRRLKDR
jgi:hypothetical protein